MFLLYWKMNIPSDLAGNDHERNPNIQLSLEGALHANKDSEGVRTFRIHSKYIVAVYTDLTHEQVDKTRFPENSFVVKTCRTKKLLRQ